MQKGGEVKPLTLQQAREFIAEKAGWEIIGHSRFQNEPDLAPLPIPDYFNPEDREALYWMHKAEETLCGNLYKLYNDRETHERWCAYQAHLRYCIRATAPQRARAFCQVFGYAVEPCP